jgi:hypothetical protein
VPGRGTRAQTEEQFNTKSTKYTKYARSFYEKRLTSALLITFVDFVDFVLKYTVMAWHEAASLESRRVVVPDAGGEVEVNFTLGRR